MSLVEVKVPDIGDFDEVAVIELLVKPGETIKPEQSLVTVESDKASMEIPSTHAGVVKEMKVKLGDKVKRRFGLADAGGFGGCGAAPAPGKAACARGHTRSFSAGARRAPAMPAEPTWNATCWCSAPAQAATPPPSARPTSA